MQRISNSSASTPFFNTNIWTSGNSSSPAREPSGRSRPSTSHGSSIDETSSSKLLLSDRLSGGLTKEPDRRKNSFGSRRSSVSSPSKGKRRRASSAANGGPDQFVTDASTPPALPDFAAAIGAASKLARQTSDGAAQSPESPRRRLARSTAHMSTPIMVYGPATTPPISQGAAAAGLVESNIIYQHIQEVANKRISTLDYLRKTHEGRVYWFNTLLFDKPDLARMHYFDARKLARRATNYLLLGLSLPMVIDLNSSTPLEFLRSLNTLLTEFESYQQIHTENGVNASSLSRARLPQMFRRPGGKGRRTSGAGDLLHDMGVNQNMNNGGANQTPTSVISFGLGGEGSDLLPGEEYTHLLTPSLPFDPDFFETFATLCDMLIDCYTRLMNLLPSARECTPLIAELFTKVDGRVRKIIIQGIVKEFEDTSRAGLKQEVGSLGKVVLGGLM
ncbi:hypothetical protein BX600DRAFT_510125 [Xylariales sp. PMI_506]|nr:hypothetical protein BX600DRAFT_510125 [Xylariales sp. PMI_506]